MEESTEGQKAAAQLEAKGGSSFTEEAQLMGKPNRRARMSLRQRLKLSMETVEKYQELLGQANVTLQAARYAAQQYRRRWIWTMVSLGIIGLAAVGALLVG